MNTLNDLCAAEDDRWNQDSENEFSSRLRDETNVEMLAQIATDFTPYSRVSIPICNRILELEPNNMQAIILLAWILWLDGEDNESKRTLERARSIDSENVEVWLLDAALTHDHDKKVELYHKVLAKDPANIVAKGKLTEFQN